MTNHIKHSKNIYKIKEIIANSTIFLFSLVKSGMVEVLVLLGDIWCLSLLIGSYLILSKAEHSSFDLILPPKYLYLFFNISIKSFPLSYSFFIHVKVTCFYGKELINSMYSPKPVVVNLKGDSPIISTETVSLSSPLLGTQSSSCFTLMEI